MVLGQSDTHERITLDPYVILYTKTKPKRVTDQNTRAKTRKEENTGANLRGFGSGNGVLDTKYV